MEQFQTFILIVSAIVLFIYGLQSFSKEIQQIGADRFQGIMTIDAAVPIVIGANMGATSAALIVSLKMTKISRLSALANFGFNVVAMLLVFPFIGRFIGLLRGGICRCDHTDCRRYHTV